MKRSPKDPFAPENERVMIAAELIYPMMLKAIGKKAVDAAEHPLYDNPIKPLDDLAESCAEMVCEALGAIE